MFCCQEDQEEHKKGISIHETPLKVKLIQNLGLKSFAINQFVFARPASST